MIKRYLFISIFFTSCSSIDYPYFNDLRNVLSKNKILVDESFIEKQVYSFIKVSNSKNDAVFILSNIDQFGVYEWIGSNYESIKTKDGLIIETKGLRSDIKFYSYDISNLEKALSFSSQIDLYNPDLIYADITLRRNSSSTYKNNKGNEMNVIQYTRTVPEIGWKAKESYTFKDGVIYKSIQQINPMLDPLEINFYFKY
ncbi:YjbF family lipoprotein [Gammaproteobacteria bacterium]|nr:YjbF family lipoprotein [Gammaproteobacteria bacterium]MDC0090050.1 YjbF family lipoprotein [Gammaproteobacteria bacterium]